MTISKYLARGLRVRRSGVLPLGLGPNSVAERVNSPGEILGRQSGCPTRFIHCPFQSNLRYNLFPNFFFLPAPKLLEPLKNYTDDYQARSKFFHCQVSSLPVISLNVVAATWASGVSSLSLTSNYGAPQNDVSRRSIKH